MNKLYLLLRCIPYEPGQISPKDLAQMMASCHGITDYLSTEANTETGRKRLQRDMKGLQNFFGKDVVLRHGKGKKSTLYSLDDKALFPSIDVDAALLWKLALMFWRPLIPGHVYNALEERAKLAEDNLSKYHKRWLHKVQVRSRQSLLEIPAIDPAILKTVQSALFNEYPLSIEYVKKGHTSTKSYAPLHPHLLLFRDGLCYLVGQGSGDDTLKQFALHRIRSAKRLSDVPYESPGPNFDPKTWVDQNANYGAEAERMKLRLRMSLDAVEHLREQELGQGQTIIPLPDSDWCEVETQVHYSESLTWWLLGLGPNVEVLEPEDLRDTLRERLQKTVAYYV